MMECRRATDGRVKKRKAESQDINNERLSKRLGLLNLERNGDDDFHTSVEQPTSPKQPVVEDDTMQLDDTKNKVYIYNLDKELEDIESSENENKLVFLPDIEKHLLNMRIPPSVLANKDGELAGLNQNQALVLYDIPHSLTMTDEKDSVRKAILEARHRAQAKQKSGRGEDKPPPVAAPMTLAAVQPPKSTLPPTINNIAEPVVEPSAMGDDTDVMDLD